MEIKVPGDIGRRGVNLESVNTIIYIVLSSESTLDALFSSFLIKHVFLSQLRPAMALPAKQTLQWKSPPPMSLHSLGPVLLQHLPVRESIPELTTSNQNSFLVLNFILSKAESVKSTSNVMRQTNSRRFLLRTGLSDLMLFKGVRYNRACIKVVVPELIVDQNRQPGH